MKFNRITAVRREFNFRLAGRWLILGSAVGIVSGLGAISFQLLLEFVKDYAIVYLMGLQPGGPGGESHISHVIAGYFNPFLVVLIPTIGGLITGIMVYGLAPEAEGHGTDEAIKAFHRNRGIIRPIIPIVKLFASVISIGTGGSGGREGPIAQIGAGFGSYLSLRLGLNTKMRRWLLAAGMGAGIGSIFRAPLAGAIFAAEVLYSSAEVETEVLLPATVSSIIAYSVYSFRFGWEHIFTEAGQYGFTNPLELIPYTAEALILAVVAFLFIKSFYGIRNFFLQWKIPRMLKPALGGLFTGLLALILIELTGDQKYIIDVMGGGYGILQEIFKNGIINISLVVLILVAFGKILTTSFTIGSGGSAGVFGPSMVIGGTLGAALGYIMQFIFPGILIHPSTFAIVGMAGFFAAAANTPLSTIIMVSELTGNYELLLPSMWVCAISYLVARKWSIYQSQVSGKIHSQAHFSEYSYDIFENTSVEEAFKKTRRFMTVPYNWKIQEILKIVNETRQRIFPVMDKNDHLIGAFNTDDITHVLQEENGSDKTAVDLMHRTVLEAYPDETIGKAQQIMLENQSEELLVVDPREKPPKIKGIITAADIIMAYNRKLSQMKFGTDKPAPLPEDKSLLMHINLNRVLEKDLATVEPEAKLGELVQIIIHSKRNIFPVVDKRRKYYGIIHLNDIRELVFNTEKYDSVLVKDILSQPEVVNIDDPMNRVMEKFEKTNAWNLPVIDRHNRYRGIVSKSTIFSVYRKQLIHQAEV